MFCSHSNFPEIQNVIYALLAVDHGLDNGQSSREFSEQDVSNPLPRAVRRQVVLSVTLLFYEKDIGMFRRGHV